MRSKWQSKEEWQKLIDKQAQSGLTIPKFCKEESLSESAFYSRKSKLKNAAAGFAQVKVMKLDVLVTRCQLPNGFQLEFEQAQPLGQLLKILGQSE